MHGAKPQFVCIAATRSPSRQSLGPWGADNPQIRAAMAALEQAHLDLARTDVLAPADGLVTTVGQHAGAGQAQSV